MAMRARAVGCLALGVFALMLSAPAANAALTGPATPEAATSSVQVVAAADAGSVSPTAADRVAQMSVREKAASVVMGHVPSTDAAALADYMGRTGIGGFILMGANIPATEAELRVLTAALTTDAGLPPLIAID